jgi:exonuclease SbcD
MYRFLIVGDLHLRGNNPRNRIDDYPTAAKKKLREVFTLAAKHKVEAILQPGDVFDRPEVSISVLLDYAELLKESPVPIYTTLGNHDVYGYNTGSYHRTSLKLLEMLVPQLHVIVSESDYVTLGSGRLWVTATPYSQRMDIDGYGYGTETDSPNRRMTHIHLAHGMLLDHKPPFDRYSDLYKVPSNADLVISGHDHLGYGVYKRADGVTFCNPGSLLRMSASVHEIERTVQIALATINTASASVQIDLIPLRCAKSGDEVLDRSGIEETRERQYAMEAFSTLIQTHTGGKVLMDVNHIIETIAAEEHVAPEVVKAALAVIDQQREAVGV